MGIDANGTRILLYAAKKLDVSFSSTAVIGRQALQLSSRSLSKRLREFGHDVNVDQARALIEKRDGFAEPLFELLGAREVKTFDANDYEGASDIHDFNYPIPDRYEQKFSAVVDAGSLEHVFNFPIAITNCMNMVKVDGHFISITPANNFFGHGFYQFSPEIYCRLFEPQNGFRLEKLIFFEHVAGAPWFEVSDPKRIGRRIQLVTRRSAYLVSIGKRTANVKCLRAYPQQSDFVASWINTESQSKIQPKIDRLKKAIPYSVRPFLGTMLRRVARYDARLLKRMNPSG